MTGERKGQRSCSTAPRPCPQARPTAVTSVSPKPRAPPQAAAGAAARLSQAWAAAASVSRALRKRRGRPEPPGRVQLRSLAAREEDRRKRESACRASANGKRRRPLRIHSRGGAAGLPCFSLRMAFCSVVAQVKCGRRAVVVPETSWPGRNRRLRSYAAPEAA